MSSAIIPVVLHILVITKSIWFYQERLTSIITPRYLMWFLHSFFNQSLILALADAKIQNWKKRSETLVIIRKMYYSVLSDTGILAKKIQVLLSGVEPKTFRLLVQMLCH